MITLEQVTEILKQRADEITEIQEHPNGFVRARFANKVDPAWPYILVVDPIPEELVLRICVLRIAKIRPEGTLLRTLAKVSPKLKCGCVGIDNTDELLYQINHICTGVDHSPGLEILERLLDEANDAVRAIEKIVMFDSLLESGIPRDRAEAIMKSMFPEDEQQENESEENETL